MTNYNHITNGYVLGLDIGIGSVGAALLGKDRIIELYARTFEKAETSDKGEPLNKIRRDARSSRRRLYRRARRMVQLSHAMKRIGLIEGNFLKSQQEWKNNPLNPWQLRSEGLDRRLEPFEWATIIYHIIRHRGFHSNRKSEMKLDEKNGEMLLGMKQTSSLLREKNYRTIGELFYKDEFFSDTKRNKRGSYKKTVNRRELLDELNMLFKQQRAYQNVYTSESFEQEVNKILMARKPALSGESLLKMVGYCTFEPTEKRCPKSSIYAERFIWLGKLNNLRVICDGVERPLSKTEHHLLKELPFESSKVTYALLKKKLKLMPDENFSVVQKPEDEKKLLFEARGFHALRECYEAAHLDDLWLRDLKNYDRLHDIAYALSCYKEDDEVRSFLIKRGVDDTIIEAVLSVSFDKFINLSLVALKNILPHLEEGLCFSDAVAAVPQYNKLSTQSKKRYLPPFDPEEICNPVVYRSLTQARKQLNAIIKKHGSPSAIHIEFARDLAKSKKERDEITKQQKEFQKIKEHLKEEFKIRFGVSEPFPPDLLKFRLHKDQNGQCAYSLEKIEVSRLCENGYAEIDHIIPYSRCFDDSLNNKVLVLTKENRNKSNRTPYEYLDGDGNSERWQRFYAWVKNNNLIKMAKKRRLLIKDFKGENASKFKERNLSDTRYVCRRFKKHIDAHLQFANEVLQEDGGSMSSKTQCVVVSGPLTAHLRHRWGLIKEREKGDLHHALDAAVVAAASRSMMNRLSNYARTEELKKSSQSKAHTYVDPDTGEKLETKFPKPWENFKEELIARLSPDPQQELKKFNKYSVEELKQIKPIRVSRMPTRRGRGGAHEDTIRSIGKNGSLYEKNRSSTKVPLKKLKLKDLTNIIGYDDPRNRDLITAIKERLENAGDNGEKAFSSSNPLRKPGKNVQTAPLVHTVKLKSVQNNGVLVRRGIACNSDMLRVDFFVKNKKFYVVPIYVADYVLPTLPNQAATAKKSKKDWLIMDETSTFLFSLFKNDWLKIHFKKGIIQEGYFVGLDISTSSLTLQVHDRNPEKGKKGQIRGIGIQKALSIEKYHVDILGNLYRAKSEVRKPLRQGQFIISAQDSK